jgi:hypothetical protein
MVNMTTAVIKTGARVETSPDSELDLLSSLRPFPTLGSLLGSYIDILEKIKAVPTER